MSPEFTELTDGLEAGHGGNLGNKSCVFRIRYKNMPKFEFRIRFNLHETFRVGHNAREMLLFEDPQGRKHFLKSAQPGRIKDCSHLAITGGPYDSENEARKVGERARNAILMWALKDRIGIDLGDDKPRGNLTAFGFGLFESLCRCILRPDIHGLDVYERKELLRFTEAVPSLQRLGPPTPLSRQLSVALTKPMNLTDKQVVAAELYCSSYFDVSPRSRLITLISSLEALLDAKTRSTSALLVVDNLKNIVKQAGLDSDTTDAMLGSIQWLKDESIGQSGKKLSAALLASHSYRGRTAPQFFTDCYSLRSDLLHRGIPADPSVDLAATVNELDRFVADLLLASIG